MGEDISLILTTILTCFIKIQELTGQLLQDS